MTYKVYVSSKQVSINDAIIWCMDEFTTHDFTINTMFPDDNWLFNFRKEQHAVLFALKWM